MSMLRYLGEFRFLRMEERTDSGRRLCGRYCFHPEAPGIRYCRTDMGGPIGGMLLPVSGRPCWTG